MILISDGENHEEKALQRAREAKANGLVIHTVAVGTTAGATIPTTNGGFQRDFTGQVIRTSVNEPFLRELAQSGGGEAVNIDDPGAIAALKAEIDRLQKSAVAAQVQTVNVSYFQWLLVPVLLLLALEQLMWWRKKSRNGEELVKKQPRNNDPAAKLQKEKI